VLRHGAGSDKARFFESAMSDQQPDYYRILGVSPQAPLPTIQAAFKQAQKKLKARSKASDTTGIRAAYERLKMAYDVLSDPKRRAVYDSLLQEAYQPNFQLSLDLSRDTLAISGHDQLIYLLAEVTAESQETNQQGQRPLNLSFVVDRSTSMKGERLRHVKQAASLIFDKLAPQDMISLISFSDRAEVIIPATSNTNYKLLHSRVNAIFPSGGTEIYQGLLAAHKQLCQNNLTRYNNHLILLTDGHTYGDEHECLALAQEMAKQGIGISAFGIGTEWNDQFLDKLVAPSGGRSDFIETPEQVLTFLQERIQGLGTVHGRNVRLLNRFPKLATLTYGFKLSPFTQPLDLLPDEITLGEIEGRSPLSFLLEIRITAQPVETRIRLPIEILVSTANNGQEKRYKSEAQCLVLTEAPAAETPSPYLMKAVRVMNMYRMNEKAWSEVEAGNLEQATRRMRHLTTRLLEAGETRLAQQAHVEADRLSRLGTISLEGRKAIKYGTRALIDVTAHLKQDD
jgi:Ca-activated chloride channel homolog